MDKRSYQVTVKGLCFDDSGRVLLIQENTGLWDLPGGRMEHGEDFHTTLSRECREEMGVECQIIDEYPYRAWSAKNYDGLWKVVLCFRIGLPHMNVITSDECIAFEFVAAKDLFMQRLAPQILPLRECLMLSVGLY